jgi:hypothetical protein
MGANLSMRSRAFAVKELQTSHSDEWETLLASHRVALGLPAHSLSGETPEKIKEKIDRAQARIEKWTAKLNGNA